MKIVPGVYFDLPAEDYHAADGVSQSMLQHMDPPARLPVYLAEKREHLPMLEGGDPALFYRVKKILDGYFERNPILIDCGLDRRCFQLAIIE